MTIRTPLLALALAALAGCASSTSTDGASTLTMKVEGLACPNCAEGVAHELQEVRGVKNATVDFDSSTATVQLDPANPASKAELEAAVAKWRTEHFGAAEDPDCLDPAKREEIKKSQH